MVLDFNKPFLDLEDRPILVESDPYHMGKVLASILKDYTEGDANKMIFWAKKLNKKESLELDPTDMSVLKSIIENLKVQALYRAQWLQVFLEAK